MQIQFGSIGERVLDRVATKVLIDVIPPVMASTGALCLDGPGILHPAAFVDVVDEIVTERAATRPDETVEAADLVEQLALVFLRRE